jgi:hypothetical protein
MRKGDMHEVSELSAKSKGYYSTIRFSRTLYKASNSCTS